MKLISLLLMFVLSGCTYSINMVHSEGEASDVIDEVDDNTPRLAIPITPLK
jgi:hypothetical protein